MQTHPRLERRPAHALPHCALSRHCEEAVRRALARAGVQHAPVHVRLVSKSDLSFEVADELRAHGFASEVPYTSKCLAAFQTLDGGTEDVLFFAVYVQEYFEGAGPWSEGRVSLSYIDSVRHFSSQPTGHRSTVYHSLIIAYLDDARRRGFTHAHIWVAPPRPGDDFIFHCHPEEMYKRMGLLKLKSWCVALVPGAPTVPAARSTPTRRDAPARQVHGHAHQGQRGGRGRLLDGHVRPLPQRRAPHGPAHHGR